MFFTFIVIILKSIVPGNSGHFEGANPESGDTIEISQDGV
jgi:hypothetical protein